VQTTRCLECEDRGLCVNIIMLDNMSPGDIAKVHEELMREFEGQGCPGGFGEDQ
jgi:hypothetical protein